MEQRFYTPRLTFPQSTALMILVNEEKKRLENAVELLKDSDFTDIVKVRGTLTERLRIVCEVFEEMERVCTRPAIQDLALTADDVEVIIAALMGRQQMIDHLRRLGAKSPTFQLIDVDKEAIQIPRIAEKIRKAYLKEE